jgi:thiol-disulfide isomerase/thioredoxin
MTKALVAVSVLAGALTIPQAQPFTVTTGEPVLIDTGGAGTTLAMTEPEYQRFVEQMGKANPAFVPIAKKPDGLSAKARFGVNLVLRGKNLCWAIDGDQDAGYVLYADWNGDGSLADETPLRFERVDGRYSVRVRRLEHEGDVTYPVSLLLVLDWVAPPGKTETQLALKNYNRTTRTGEIVRPGGGAPVAFRITGASGFYAQAYNIVAFDLNGDGSYDADTEIFRVSEQYVNIGDTSYQFAVDRYGRSLTLTPLAEHRPSRAALTAGSLAPDFAFTDIDGVAHRLSDYRGKVVLLDFWGVWCAPCVAEAPKLVGLYEKFHERGLEILGLDTGDTRERVATFLTEHKIRWPQTMEADRGPIQTLYRINGWPTYFLLDRDGKITRGAFGSGTNVEREVEAMLSGGR